MEDMRRCHHTSTTEAHGDVVCLCCGAVVGRTMSELAEWYGNDDARCRSEFVSGGGPIAAAAELPASFIGGCTVVARLQARLNSQKRKRAYDADAAIEEVCRVLNLSDDVARVSARMLDIVINETGIMWRGARRNGAVGACVSLACASLSVGITEIEIAACPFVSIPLRTLHKHIKVIRILTHNHGAVHHIGDRPQEYCKRFCAELGYFDDVRDRVCRMAERFALLPHMHARSCKAIAAVSTMHVAATRNLSISVTDLARTADVRKSTLVKWYADAVQIGVCVARDAIAAVDNSETPDGC